MVATVFLIFALASTYIPQDWNKISITEAAPASEFTQKLNNIQLGQINVSETTSAAQNTITATQSTISAAQNTITAVATNSLWIKENLLDGIAWAIAKTFISSMVQSLVTWINSGFKGSPMFVQDLEGFLRNAADKAIGQYLDELGGVGSFLCDPFKLDIQIAIALEYDKIRSHSNSKCTLTGIIDNIEDFMSGVEGSFSKGGWNDWFDITAKPEKYTPFGAGIAAQNEAHIRILGARTQENTKLGWGAGFLSGEICNTVSGPGGTTKEECVISKPGKIIEEALSFNLDSGRESLITADEIDEIVVSLLAQLSNQALTGAFGLLGLSSGTGYTYSGFKSGSYLGDMTQTSLNAISTTSTSTPRPKI